MIKINKLVALLIGITTLMGSQVVLADYEPPYNCKEGRDDLKFWGKSHYLRFSGISNNKLVQVNKDIKISAKIDYHDPITGDDTWVHFWSSEHDFVDDDKVRTNHRHASAIYNFDEIGEKTIWVNSEDGEAILCAYITIKVVEKLPVGTSGGGCGGDSGGCNHH